MGTLAGILAGAALYAVTSATLAAAMAGGLAVLGAIAGFCNCRMSRDRLPLKADGDTSVLGVVIDVGRSGTYFPFGDGDFLFNIKCVRPEHVVQDADCVRHKASGVEYLHCEITSNVTLYGCAGAYAGAIAGMAVGVPTGAAAGAAVAAGCIATGIFAPLCIIAAIIVAAIISAAISGAGALGGAAIGSELGVAADEDENVLGDPGADVVKEGDLVVFSGDWVSDADHGWNEIHDIERAMVLANNIQLCDQAWKTAAAAGLGLKKHAKTGGQP